MFTDMADQFEVLQLEDYRIDIELWEENFQLVDFRHQFPTFEEDSQCIDNAQKTWLDLTSPVDSSNKMSQNLLEITNSLKQIDIKGPIENISEDDLDSQQDSGSEYEEEKDTEKSQILRRRILLTSKPQNKNKPNRKMRWNRNNDIDLFKHLRVLLPLTSLSNLHLYPKKGRVSTEYKWVLNKLKQAIKWKGNIYDLRRRISRVLTMTEFTCRDIRRVKALTKKYYNEEITQQDLCDNFPGKTLQQILKFRKK